MTDHPDPDASRRVAVFVDVHYLPLLDMALRMAADFWQRDHTPGHALVREAGLAEVKAFRSDLARQINQSMTEGIFLPPK